MQNVRLLLVVTLVGGGCGLRQGYSSPGEGQLSPEDLVSFDGLVGAFGLSEGILLVWNPARGGDGSEHYLIDRATNQAGPYANIADLPAGSMLYLDTHPASQPGVTYYYRVQVEFLGNFHGDDTPDVSAQSPPPEVQTLQFAGVGGAVFSRSSITVLWSTASGVDPTDVTYNLYRSETSGGFTWGTPTVTLPAATNVYVDDALPDLTDGKLYYYAVRAVYQSAEDNNTREASAAVEADPPQVLTCPAGMANVDEQFCIDVDDHDGLSSTTAWQDSKTTCQSEGKTLCTMDQWYTACSLDQAFGTIGLNNVFDGYEWVNDLASATNAHKMGYSSGDCSAVSSHGFDGGYDFRCCF